jgi:hypothetical protein
MSSKKKDDGAGTQQMTALVVEADDPLDNRVKVGKSTQGTVRILIDTKPAATYVARSFKLDRDHWPIRGMELPVLIDPAKPDQFEIDWEQVPSIEERAAANDPTLADPRGTKKKTMETLIASGAAGPGADVQGWTGATPDIPQDVRQVVVAAQAAEVKKGEQSGMADHFQESLDKAAQEPAPAGKTRAVALISASEATLRQEGGGDDGTGSHNVRSRQGKHDAVLAVNVPGQEPYAVFISKFKHPRGKGSPVGAGLPALVSSSDPRDVEVLWDELLSVKDQAQKTKAEAMQTASDRMADATKQMNQAFQQAGPPPPGAAPAPGAAGMPQMPANMQAMMAENAKKALEFAKDPATRKLLIQQYRAAGIEIDEEDAGG